MKRLLCCALIALTVLLPGCIPIGVRASTQLASTSTVDSRGASY
jgi:hypothetical protein